MRLYLLYDFIYWFKTIALVLFYLHCCSNNIEYLFFNTRKDQNQVIRNIVIPYRSSFKITFSFRVRPSACKLQASWAVGSRARSKTSLCAK